MSVPNSSEAPRVDRYQVLASLIDTADFDDNYGTKTDLIKVLGVMSTFDRIELPIVRKILDDIYSAVADGWVTVSWLDENTDA